jgi:hypothetical protein
MTRADIEQCMAEAGLKAPARGDFIFIHWDQIALLIEHQRADEREACAKLVQDNSMACDPGSVLQVYLASNAAAIRARSET